MSTEVPEIPEFWVPKVAFLGFRGIMGLKWIGLDKWMGEVFSSFFAIFDHFTTF